MIATIVVMTLARIQIQACMYMYSNNDPKAKKKKLYWRNPTYPKNTPYPRSFFVFLHHKPLTSKKQKKLFPWDISIYAWEREIQVKWGEMRGSYAWELAALIVIMMTSQNSDSGLHVSMCIVTGNNFPGIASQFAMHFCMTAIQRVSFV